MLEFTWGMFSQTGNIDTYLLFKELEVEKRGRAEDDEEIAEIDFPVI